MKLKRLAAAGAAALATAALATPATQAGTAKKPPKDHPAKSQRWQQFEDGNVGNGKAELLVQISYSRSAVQFFTAGKYSWMVARRHRSCSTVGWTRTCLNARRQLAKHRWLYQVARAKYRKLYLPKPRRVTYAAGICWACWDRVAHCESSGNWHINTGNGFYGGLQFTHDTWKAWGGRRYAYEAHQATREQQIVIANGHDLSNWPVCGRNYYG